jgi:membrane associated rhomboid family serine protease
MGGGGGWRSWSFNTWLIVINVIVFVIGAFLPDNVGVLIGMQHLFTPDGHPILNAAGQPMVKQIIIPMDILAAYGHFSTARGFFGLEVWRLVTFQFLHAGFTHILFNMFGLWIFGRLVEQHLGSKRYVAFYLICGIFGGLTYLLLNVLGVAFQSQGITLPGLLIEYTGTPLIGASAGVFGVIMACAYIAPNAVVQLLFPPIPLRMKTFAYGYVAFAAFALLTGRDNAGGQAAHIGGAVAGYFFIRNAHLLGDFFDIFGDSRKTGQRRAKRGRKGGPRAPSQAEVDRILAKVATQGLQSLTEAEKKALRQATEAQRRS